MEIIKNTESFKLKETTAKFETSGTISREISGSLNIHFNVNSLEGERLGDGHYSRYGENSEVNFGINCSEERREELTNYADSIIDTVLLYFKNH